MTRSSKAATGLITALMLCLSLVPASAAPPTATASACTWAHFKLTNRTNVTCSTAKRVIKAYYGGGDMRGFKCRATAASGYTKGKCTKGPDKSFKFAPAG